MCVWEGRGDMWEVASQGIDRRLAFCGFAVFWWNGRRVDRRLVDGGCLRGGVDAIRGSVCFRESAPLALPGTSWLVCAVVAGIAGFVGRLWKGGMVELAL
jgi:hypothetical protein